MGRSLSRTFHAYLSSDGQWSVQKDGAKAKHFASRAAAVRQARMLAKKRSVAQVVVHETDGLFTINLRHGLPPLERRPRRPATKDSLGTDQIMRAVSSVIRKRLEST